MGKIVERKKLKEILCISEPDISFNLILKETKLMKIVILDGYTLNPGDLSWDGLKQLGEVTIYDRTPKEKVLERSKDAEVILSNKTPVGEDVIRQLPSLKFIGVLATGFNVIDVEAAKKQSVIVFKLIMTI